MMAFEKQCLDHVKFDVAVKHELKIEPWFQYGTLWCDHIDEDIAETIQHSIINFCSKGTSVSKSLLKATDTEPWDQWAFDII